MKQSRGLPASNPASFGLEVASNSISFIHEIAVAHDPAWQSRALLGRNPEPFPLLPVSPRPDGLAVTPDAPGWPSRLQLPGPSFRKISATLAMARSYRTQQRHRLTRLWNRGASWPWTRSSVFLSRCPRRSCLQSTITIGKFSPLLQQTPPPARYPRSHCKDRSPTQPCREEAFLSPRVPASRRFGCRSIESIDSLVSTSRAGHHLDGGIPAGDLDRRNANS
jgi:hypothetical protein